MLVIAVYGFFVFYKIQIVPVHFWMARRFLPVILPGAFLLLAGGAFYGVWSRKEDDAGQPRGRWRRVMRQALLWVPPLVFVALVGTSLARATRPILWHVEYQGMVTRLDNLAGSSALATW